MKAATLICENTHNKQLCLNIFVHPRCSVQQVRLEKNSHNEHIGWRKPLAESKK